MNIKLFISAYCSLFCSNICTVYWSILIWSSTERFVVHICTEQPSQSSVRTLSPDTGSWAHNQIAENYTHFLFISDRPSHATQNIICTYCVPVFCSVEIFPVDANLLHGHLMEKGLLANAEIEVTIRSTSVDPMKWHSKSEGKSYSQLFSQHAGDLVPSHKIAINLFALALSLWQQAWSQVISTEKKTVCLSVRSIRSRHT